MTSRRPDRVEELLTAIQGELGLMASAFRDLKYTKIIDSGTVVVGAGGYVERSYPVPYAAVTLLSHSADRVTAATAVPAGAAPTQGRGVAILEPYGAGTFNMAGRDLTIYGNPGDAVTVTVSAAPQPAAASSGAAPPAVADLYSEPLTSRVTAGTTAAFQWPATATSAWVSLNCTVFTGGTNFTVALEQMDANGVWQTIDTGEMTAAGQSTFTTPGVFSGAMIRGGGAVRLAWTLTGSFSALTFQIAVSAR